ncbi:hypothetical protein F383_34995 [Gossypium arboreum]|uniref:Uncharacterized protein n=1 Tax=Gossypium arboreum TaxID=29729 RepID=A0A0B0PUW3_GOSAR|nr:hypothetical protein F383_34995 [Gossypium arboreum]
MACIARLLHVLS